MSRSSESKRQEAAAQQGGGVNWSKWERCVIQLLPGDRELLLLAHGSGGGGGGGIDPSAAVSFRDDFRVQRVEHARANGEDDYDSDDDDDDDDEEEDGRPGMEELLADREHPGRFSHGPPLLFLDAWADTLRLLRPPPELHRFHRLWRQRRQQAMGLAPPPHAAVTGQVDSDDEQDMQPRQKKPRLAPARQAGASEAEVHHDEEDVLQSSRALVQELLELPRPHCRHEVEDPAPLSPKELRELAPLLPGGHELSAKELAKKVQESKTQLILDLVLEDRVRTLLEFGADPNPEPPTHALKGDCRLRFPLISPCPIPAIRLLLEAKADPNWSLRHGAVSPLYYYSSNPEVVGLMLAAGASPHHTQLRENGRITDPAIHPLFLSFVSSGAPAESFRLLLEHNPQIIGHHEHGRAWTPISQFVQSYRYHPHIRDLVLQIPFPIPAECATCEDSHAGCWGTEARNDPQACRSPEFLRTLVRIGYPTRGRVEAAIESLLDNRPRPDPRGVNLRERLEILQSVTEEGQTQRRQEHLGRFWTRIMRAAPGVSGVVASLVLQAIVPEFQLRIA